MDLRIVLDVGVCRENYEFMALDSFHSYVASNRLQNDIGSNLGSCSTWSLRIEQIF